MLSCRKDEVVLEKTLEQKIQSDVKFDFKVNSDSKLNLATSLEKYKYVISEIESNINIEQPNMSDVYSVNLINHDDAKLISLNLSSKNLNEAYTLSSFISKKGESRTMLTKIDKANKLIVYYFLEDREFVSVDIASRGTQTGRLNSLNAALRTSGWGQRTMDCITDAYSNYGWASVAAWVVSAFQPSVAVAIAAVCAYREYH